MKKQKRTVGAIVKVPFNDGYHTYARILKDAHFAFYDCRTHNNMQKEISQIGSCQILFTIGVHNDVITSGRWQVLGLMKLEPHLSIPPPTFIQDSTDPTNISIYQNGIEHPATIQDCIGLERLAVWDSEHVEERLRDHYSGQVNRWVELQKLIIP